MKEKDITRTLQLVKQKGHGLSLKQPRDGNGDFGVEEISIGDIFVKAFRHKMLMFVTIVCVLMSAVALFAAKGTWYSRTNVSQFNNFENNALFFMMDSLVPSDDTRRSDNKQEYASRAVSALGADDFLKFVYDFAKTDKQLGDLFQSQGIDVRAELNPETWDRLRLFMDASAKISAPQGGGGILKLQTTGYFLTAFKGPNREFVDKFSENISRLMSQYLSKRELEDVQATRQIVTERLEAFKKDIAALNEKRANLIASTPQWSPETYNTLSLELEQARASVMGNKAMELRLGGLFTDLENKVRALNEGAADEEVVENLDVELQKTLSHLKTVVKAGSKSEFIGAEYQDNVAKQNKVDPKTADVYYLKQQFAYSEARVASLEKALTAIRDQINKRYAINNEIEDITKSVASKQKLTDSLETSKIRLDFADFKTLRRVEVFTGPIKYEAIMPKSSFAMLSLIFAFLLALGVAFTAETKNPSLTTTRTFEELGIPVLGGIPSTKDFLIGDALSFGNRDGRIMSYVRLAINLSNVMTYMSTKVALFTAADQPSQSATALYNLAIYFANTGRKVLLIEADFENKYLDRLIGSNTDGGLSGILSHSKEVNISPVKVMDNLHLLSGDSSTLPPVYRLASEGFLDLLEELKKEYDYILIHARPCLDSPEAADLSRYAGVVALCADAKTIRLNQLERLTGEMKLFLSRYSYFVLENAVDDASKYNSKKAKKVATKKVQKLQDKELRKAS